jgi:radical SAM-linked protein
MKLYFMIGLPTETDGDIEAIAELAKKTKKIGNQAAPGKQQINVSVGTFVPKPHTPFQWNAQISMEESREKINALKHMLPRKGINLKWHDPEQSFLEGVFSRGDRRLSHLLETAWKKGARLDGWSDYFNLKRWQEAADDCEIDLAAYLLAKDLETVLPWQHLQSGIDESFLKDELQKGLSEHYTPDCRYHSCQKCGLCDFKTLKPVVIDRKQTRQENVTSRPAHPPKELAKPEKEELHIKYMVSYSRLGDICYLGHLELLQVVFRILRRANIRTNFSKGFNPSPKVSFGPALPVGTRSMAEYFVMDLPAPLADLEEAKTRFNLQMPPGLTVLDIKLHNGSVPQQVINSYSIILHPALTAEDRVKLIQFMESDTFLVKRTRKRKTKEINIRPLIDSLTVLNDGTIEIRVISRASEAGVKPLEAITAILGKKQEDFLSSEILKTSWQELQKSCC